MSYLSKVFPMVALACLVESTAAAEVLEMPSEPPVLTISGNISETNTGRVAQFDMSMLRELESREVRTSTIWTEGEHVFTGVSLDVLLERLGAMGTSLIAAAVNDSTVEIPLSDASPTGPIVAYEMDGKAMTHRDKGPLWVIYPYDSNPAYRSDAFYDRSIRKLDRIEIIK